MTRCSLRPNSPRRTYSKLTLITATAAMLAVKGREGTFTTKPLRRWRVRSTTQRSEFSTLIARLYRGKGEYWRGFCGNRLAKSSGVVCGDSGATKGALRLFYVKCNMSRLSLAEEHVQTQNHCSRHTFERTNPFSLQISTHSNNSQPPYSSTA